MLDMNLNTLSDLTVRYPNLIVNDMLDIILHGYKLKLNADLVVGASVQKYLH